MKRLFGSLAAGLRTLWASGHDERVGGIALTVAAVVALLWANLAGHTYLHLWGQQAPWSHALGFHLTVRDWVNQGLLFAFFSIVGLEIRREVAHGELRSPRRAALPVGAALAGMAVPALVYTAVVAGHTGAGGWGIPMATDVAFALGALAIVGGVSARARVFLLTLAVADDLASILVLVLFYRSDTHLSWVPLGAVSLGVATGLWWRRQGPKVLRAGLIGLAWWALLHAGIEAAVLGVALGLVGPDRPAPRTVSTALRWERRLEPVVYLGVLPVFALANVGIVLGSSTLGSAGARRIFVAVVLARALGKPLGVLGGSLLTQRLMRPPRVSLPGARELSGVATLASIGFTVPLLVIARALPPGQLATAATAGLLVGSIVGVGAGAAVVRFRR